MTIGLYFGTQTGKTETVCGYIKDEFGDAVANAIDVSEKDDDNDNLDDGAYETCFVSSIESLDGEEGP